MPLSDHLGPDAVVLGPTGRTKAEVLSALADRAATLLGRDPAPILRALLDREALGSTGVGAGIALPHASLAEIAAPIALVARLARPVDWAAIDDLPVDLVVVVLSPAGTPGDSLDLLSKIARLLRAPDLCERLRRAGSAAAFHAALVGSAP